MEDAMQRMSKFLVLALATTVLAILAYETYEVAAARNVTKEKFAKYEAETANGTKGPSVLSQERQDILVKVQDPRFWSHSGVDWSYPLSTTVTQSVVKKLYFEDFHPGFGKIKQTLIAYFAVAPLSSKNAQLAAFLDVNGFEALSAKWFGKPLQSLSDEEFLSLIATNNTPKIAPGSKENGERVARIKKYLAGKCERRGLSDVWLDQCAAS
ncbi:transglycosylase domain-containing protein [Methylocystis sp. Sn-Cys]|nr:transglycosylase domain-containing protein [Methylocystis sp. Sn-Cys]